MRKAEEKNSILEICPIRNVVARFGNKWSLLVVLILSEREAMRFNELCRAIPDISSRVLSSTLKMLEADGLVSRTVYPEGRIPADGDRPFAGSADRPADRVGSGEHEVYRGASPGL